MSACCLLPVVRCRWTGDRCPVPALPSQSLKVKVFFENCLFIQLFVQLCCTLWLCLCFAQLICIDPSSDFFKSFSVSWLKSVGAQRTGSETSGISDG
jgi:hypothetical protein